jgi:hypothetical protein
MERKASMFSKIKVALFTVILVALAFGGFSVALAASSTPASAASAPASGAVSASAAAPAPASLVASVVAATSAPTATASNGTQWLGGHITALGANSFTVTGPFGGVHVVSVNDQSRIFLRTAQAGSFSDLKVGDRVLAAALASSTGSTPSTTQLTALLVIDFGAQTTYRGTGVATSVDSSQQSFNFINRRGQMWEFYTDSNTKITDRKGKVLSYSDIQVGTRLFVHAEKRADGKWWALNITVGKTIPPVTGTTTSTTSATNS